MGESPSYLFSLVFIRGSFPAGQRENHGWTRINADGGVSFLSVFIGVYPWFVPGRSKGEPRMDADKRGWGSLLPICFHRCLSVVRSRQVKGRTTDGRG